MIFAETTTIRNEIVLVALEIAEIETVGYCSCGEGGEDRCVDVTEIPRAIVLLSGKKENRQRLKWILGLQGDVVSGRR